jgi:hypothetical protein
MMTYDIRWHYRIVISKPAQSDIDVKQSLRPSHEPTWLLQIWLNGPTLSNSESELESEL